MADPDYFTLAEFRTLADCSGTAFTDAQINAAAAHFTTIVERELDRPLVPRSVTEELDGDGSSCLLLSKRNVRSLTSVTVDGTEVDEALLTGRNGRLRYRTVSGGWRQPFPRGVGNVVVVYSAGEDTCPADIKDPVMWATRDRLLSQGDQSGVDIRRTSVSTEFGTTSYVLPGEKRPTGYPDLDAVIASYARNTPSYGFA